jgi:integrase
VAFATISFHDLRHEGGSRLLEAGWPVHHVQHMLGHASLQQPTTYLNATLPGLHESMRTLNQFSNSLATPQGRWFGLVLQVMLEKNGTP